MPKKGVKQQGGASNWMHSFHASTAVGGPAAISKFTLQNINNAPMFKPMSPSAQIPTAPSTGIVPNGRVLAMSGGGKHKQTGGALQNKTVSQLRTLCNKNGLSCRNKQTGGFLPKASLISKLKQKGVKN